MLHKACYSLEVSILSSMSKDFFQMEMRNISFYECVSQVLSLAFPSIVGYVADMLLETINIFFVGRLNDPQKLAACGLGNCWLNITCFSVLLGLASVLETFCSQAFGKGDRQLCGAHHNRARIIIFLCTIPCIILLWNTSSVLSYLGIAINITRATEQYVKTLIPGFLFNVQFEITRRFVISQNICALPMYIILLTTVLHMLWCYIFVIVFKLGFLGVCYATDLTWLLDFFLLSGYIQFSGCCVDSWYCPGKEAFKGWFNFFKLGIPSALMLCLEWWGTELFAFEAAFLGDIQMAANVSLMNVLAISYMLPSGFSTTASILVGTAIGAKNLYNAKLYSVVCLSVDFFILSIFAIFLYSFRSSIAMFFTDQQIVQSCVIEVMPILSIVVVFDSLQCVCGGLVKGIGKQQIASISGIVSYYIIMQPICLFLAFKCKLGIDGLWIGCGIGQLACGLFYVGIIVSQNWQKVLDEAQIRIKQEMKDLSRVVESKDSSSTHKELFLSI